MNHELFTRMLFVDAVIGLGTMPLYRVFGNDGVANTLVSVSDSGDGPVYTWNRSGLDALELPTLQSLYTGLKLHEADYAH